MSIKTRLSLLMTLLFAISIGNALLVYVLENESERKLQWVTHTNKVIFHTNNLLLAISEAETGQRGYLLTDEHQYLEPYLRGTEVTRSTYNILKQLTILDNEEQQARLQQLNQVIQNKLAELAQTIALNDESPAEALRIVKSDKGKDYMDSIRRILMEFEHEEKRLLESRTANYQEARTYVYSAIFVQITTTAFLIFLLSMTIKTQLFDPLKTLISSISQLQTGKKPFMGDFLPKNEMGFVVSSFYEMSEVVHNNQQRLTEQARIDSLTGIRNRVNLEGDLERLITDAKTKEQLIAVCFIDLDELKPVNDRFGHEAGDKLLTSFAQRAQEVIRDTDIVARFGGDEFVLILTRIADAQSLMLTIEKILDNIKGAVLINDTNVDIAFSAGVAIYPKHGTQSNHLIQCADIAMYHAKRQGKNHTCYFDNTMGIRSSDNS